MPEVKAAVVRDLDTSQHLPAWMFAEVEAKIRGHKRCTASEHQSPLCFLDGPMSPDACRTCFTLADVYGICCVAVRQRQGRIRLFKPYLQSKALQHPTWQQLRSWKPSHGLPGMAGEANDAVSSDTSSNDRSTETAESFWQRNGLQVSPKHADENVGTK